MTDKEKIELLENALFSLSAVVAGTSMCQECAEENHDRAVAISKLADDFEKRYK